MTDYETTRGGFEWACPYCTTSRLNKSMDDSRPANAISALRNHVRSSDGPEHGPRNEVPEDFSDLTLADHVTWLDGSEDDP